MMSTGADAETTTTDTGVDVGTMRMTGTVTSGGDTATRAKIETLTAIVLIDTDGIGPGRHHHIQDDDTMKPSLNKNTDRDEAMTTTAGLGRLGLDEIATSGRIAIAPTPARVDLVHPTLVRALQIGIIKTTVIDEKVDRIARQIGNHTIPHQNRTMQIIKRTGMLSERRNSLPCSPMPRNWRRIARNDWRRSQSKKQSRRRMKIRRGRTKPNSWAASGARLKESIWDDDYKDEAVEETMIEDGIDVHVRSTMLIRWPKGGN